MLCGELHQGHEWVEREELSLIKLPPFDGHVSAPRVNFYLSLLDKRLQGGNLHLGEDLHLTAEVLHPSQEVVRYVERGGKISQQLGLLCSLDNALEDVARHTLQLF